MTWVLVVVVCSTLAGGSRCESEVVAHQLGQSECLAMVGQFSEQGQLAECLVEDDDSTEAPDET